MKVLLAAAAFAALATTADAAITVNGVLDSDYGAAVSSVSANPAAPISNFSAPTGENAIAYDIYLRDEGGKLYGFLQGASDTTGFNFSNLYFDIDPINANGSDIGFEIGNDRAFVPGAPGYAEGLSGITWALGANSFEFSISNDYFKGPISGLTYNSGQTFPADGGKVVLRISQSFGYSAAGGPTYGDNRLGSFTLAGGVPEPATWAMMIVGFLGVGSTLRARRRGMATA